MIEFGDELLYCLASGNKDARVFRFEDILSLEVDLSYQYPMVSPVTLCEEPSGVTYHTVHKNAGDMTNISMKEFLHQCRIHGFRAPHLRTVKKYMFKNYDLILPKRRRKKK